KDESQALKPPGQIDEAVNHDGVRVVVLSREMRPQDVVRPRRLGSSDVSTGCRFVGSRQRVLQYPGFTGTYVQVDRIDQSATPDAGDLRVLFCKGRPDDDYAKLPVFRQGKVNEGRLVADAGAGG